jgi:hypothetical protein
VGILLLFPLLELLLL